MFDKTPLINCRKKWQKMSLEMAKFTHSLGTSKYHWVAYEKVGEHHINYYMSMCQYLQNDIKRMSCMGDLD